MKNNLRLNTISFLTKGKPYFNEDLELIIFKVKPLLVTDIDHKYYLDISHLKAIIDSLKVLKTNKFYKLIIKKYSIKLLNNKNISSYEIKLIFHNFTITETDSINTEGIECLDNIYIVKYLINELILDKISKTNPKSKDNSINHSKIKAEEKNEKKELKEEYDNEYLFKEIVSLMKQNKIDTSKYIYNVESLNYFKENFLPKKKKINKLIFIN